MAVYTVQFIPSRNRGVSLPFAFRLEARTSRPSALAPPHPSHPAQRRPRRSQRKLFVGFRIISPPANSLLQIGSPPLPESQVKNAPVSLMSSPRARPCLLEGAPQTVRAPECFPRALTSSSQRAHISSANTPQ